MKVLQREQSSDQIPEALQEVLGLFIDHKEDFDLFMSMDVDSLEFAAELEERFQEFADQDYYKPLFVESLEGALNIPVIADFLEFHVKNKNVTALENTLWSIIIRAYASLLHLKHTNMNDPGEEVKTNCFFYITNERGISKIIELEENKLYSAAEPPEALTVKESRHDLDEDHNQIVELTMRTQSPLKDERIVLGKYRFSRETTDQFCLTYVKDEITMDISIKVDNPFQLARYPIVSVARSRVENTVGGKKKYQNTVYKVQWLEDKIDGRTVDLGRWVYHSDAEDVIMLRPSNKGLRRLANRLHECFPGVNLIELQNALKSATETDSRGRMKIPATMTLQKDEKSTSTREYITFSLSDGKVESTFTALGIDFIEKSGMIVYNDSESQPFERLKNRFSRYVPLKLKVDMTSWTSTFRNSKLKTPFYSFVVNNGKPIEGKQFAWEINVVKIPTQQGVVLYPVKDSDLDQIVSPEIVGNLDQTINITVEGTDYKTSNIYVRKLMSKDGGQEAWWFYHENMKAGNAFDTDDYLEDIENCDPSAANVEHVDSKPFGEIDLIEAAGSYTFLWSGHMEGPVAYTTLMTMDAYQKAYDVASGNSTSSTSSTSVSSYNSYTKPVIKEPKRKVTAMFL